MKKLRFEPILQHLFLGNFIMRRCMLKLSVDVTSWHKAHQQNQPNDK